jgi:uncharacterized protein (TIGR01777 family)
MKILVSGSTGLIGSTFLPRLSQKGHSLSCLVRSRSEAGGIYWNPMSGMLDAHALEGFDAVIHLAGESIATGRWTAAKKHRILESRVRGTKLLSDALSSVKRPPKVLVSASAIGFYGDRGDEILKETSMAGSGFLPEVCRQWENATSPASQKGIRVVNLRLGIVLSPKGGALAKMLLPFKMGLGGKIGSGKQYMSWIDLEDVLGAIEHILVNDSLRGPINITAPHAVTNAEFTVTLGRALRRPTLFPMPAFAARLAFGEMADALLLSSARVEPAVLNKSGYRYNYPDLESFLRHLLGQ